jgi:hypothetical protein
MNMTYIASDDVEYALTEHQARIQHVLNKLGIELSERAHNILWGNTFYGAPPVYGDGGLGEEEWAKLYMVRDALASSDYDPAQEILNRERK